MSQAMPHKGLTALKLNILLLFVCISYQAFSWQKDSTIQTPSDFADARPDYPWLVMTRADDGTVAAQRAPTPDFSIRRPWLNQDHFSAAISGKMTFLSCLNQRRDGMVAIRLDSYPPAKMHIDGKYIRFWHDHRGRYQSRRLHLGKGLHAVRIDLPTRPEPVEGSDEENAVDGEKFEQLNMRYISGYRRPVEMTLRLAAVPGGFEKADSTWFVRPANTPKTPCG